MHISEYAEHSASVLHDLRVGDDGQRLHPIPLRRRVILKKQGPSPPSLLDARTQQLLHRVEPPQDGVVEDLAKIVLEFPPSVLDLAMIIVGLIPEHEGIALREVRDATLLELHLL